MRTPSSQKCRLDLAPPWADRFILGITPSIAARYFSAGPSDSTSRWTPCPPKYSKRWLQVGLGYIQLSPSCLRYFQEANFKVAHYRTAASIGMPVMVEYSSNG